MSQRVQLVGSKFLAALLSTALSGCSYLFVRTDDPPNCSSHVTGPVVDTVWGTLGLFGTVVSIDSTQSDGRSFDPFGGDAQVLAPLGFSLLFLTSAIYGYTKTAECRRKLASYDPDNDRDAARRRRDDRQHRQRATLPQHAPLRLSFVVGDWNVDLLGVPEAERDVVAMRVDTRSPAQRFKGCRQLETSIDGAVSSHDATYAARVAGRQVEEALFAKLRVETLAALATAQSPALGICRQHTAVSPAAAGEIRRFLDVFAARGGLQAAPPPQPETPELNLALVLDGRAVDLLGQPTLHPEHVFVLLPGVRLDEPGCGVLGIHVGDVAMSMQVVQRAGAVPVAYTTMDLQLLQQLAGGADAGLSICGEAKPLSVEDRGAIAGFAQRFRESGLPPPELAPSADSPPPAPQPPPALDAPPALSPPPAQGP